MAHIDKLDKYRLLRVLIRRIPYRLGLSLFGPGLTNPLAKAIFAKPLRAADAVVTAICQRRLSSAEKGEYLLVNYLSYWRFHALMQLPEGEYQRYVAITGLEHLRKYYGERGIVLCNSHFGAGKLIPLALARAGFSMVSLDRVNLVDADSSLATAIESIELGKQKEHFHLKALMKMKKALTSNRLLHIAVDGYRGASGKEYAFLGRLRPLRKSFAELAVTTNAIVLPVFSCIKADGRIEIAVQAPIEYTQGAERDVMVDEVCQKYVELLAKNWQSLPSNIHKNDIRMYRGLPLLTSAQAVAG